MVAALEDVTLSSLQNAYHQCVGSHARRRVSIMLCAAVHRQEANAAIKAPGASVCIQEGAFTTLRAVKSVHALTCKPLAV